MEQRLRELVDKARTGGPDEGYALANYLRRHAPDADFLAALARADEEPFRLAAASAARGRTEPEILEAMAVLARDETLIVRVALSQAWAEMPDWPLPDEVGLALLSDDEWVVRAPAAKAAKGRAAWVARLKVILAEDPAWEAREAAARSLAEAPAAAVVPLLLAVLAEDEDLDVSSGCAWAAETHLAALASYPEDAEIPAVGVLETCRERVGKLGVQRFPLLSAWIGTQLETAVDPQRLSRFGTDLTAEAEAGRLARAHGVEDVLARVKEAITGPAPRAAVLIGDSGTGKTAIVHELVESLRHDPDGPWRVLRITPSEILVGTRYIGEWETKVQELIEAVRAPRRVLLYVPSVHELSQIGMSSKSDHNVATMLAPHIESGDVVLVGETTNQGFRSGLGAQPSLRRLFRRIELDPQGEDATRAIAAAVAAEVGVNVPESVLDRLLELASFYLPSTAEPGRAVGLLRQVIERHEDADLPLDAGAVVETLSATTGVPVGMLDDSRPLDLDDVRLFLEARVRGQEEPVAAMVDLVALIKAGLADPTKPYGIFLFVGPTGVGKTELARSLAELLFGDPARVRRYDMSEYATFESFERLIGTARAPGLLTEAVRETPFSVFLLDEIEKAHLNVFDLCLQIFDAGRLTDRVGRTADFRRTIFILTSNVGSMIQTEKAVGFGATEPPPPDAAATERALRHFFRPEFLGRIDRIIHFRPLAEETAEWIARREVERVLERGGITRRQLTIDIDPSVFSFLLKRGYSPALGARPLKRTVERCILLPVARAVATGAVAPGSILRLKARRDDVVVEVENPEGDATPVTAEGDAQRSSASPAVKELEGRVAQLTREVDALRAGSEALAQRRQGLLARSRAEGFWDDQTDARRVLGEIARWEGVFQALGTLDRRVRDTSRHVGEATPRRLKIAKLADRLGELEAEARRIAFLLSSHDAHDLADAIVTVSCVKAEGVSLDAVEQVARMYLGFGPRHGLEVEVLDDHRTTDPREDSISILVSGAGAYGLLTAEAGLHLFARRAAPPEGKQRQGHRRSSTQREVVRVDVWPLCDEDDDTIPESELRIDTRPLREETGRLIRKPNLEVMLLHVPSMTAVRAWGEGRRRDVVARLLPLLCARLQGEAASAPEEGPAVRRYELGASPLVRDRRSGRQTGRLDRVLAGDLDVFFTRG